MNKAQSLLIVLLISYILIKEQPDYDLILSL
jgi:hypothetical protein